jgi:hypothetical protein
MLLSVAALGLAISAVPSSAQNNCLQDEYAVAGNHQKLQCTANDVRVAFADNVRGLDGAPLPTCQLGSTFNFVADFHVVTTATARENIGLYFQTNGGATALSGTCSDNIIAPPHHSANALDTVCLGSGTNASCTGTGTYEELDAAPDKCGDISTSDNNQVVTVEVDNAACKPAAGSNLVALPNCTSWQQPGGTILCKSSTPNWPYDLAAIPGSPSKCNCDSTFTIPVVVQSPSISVTKACTTNITTGNTNVLCDAGVEGSDVIYTVTVNNTSNFGNLTINQICDSAYGNIATATGVTPCSTPNAIGTASSTTCSVPQTVAGGSNYACTFTAHEGESGDVKDTATASGLGSDGKTPVTGTSNQVEVTSTDAPTTATVAKTLVGTQAACVTVRYGVDVHNSSGADESITLSSFTDSVYGSITTVHGDVLGTTCGVPAGSPGLGTLSSVTASATNGGALSATLAVGGSDYQCQFDAQFCGALSTITTGAGTCTGIKHSNTVTPTLAGDEGESVTQTGGALTVNECISGSAQ